MADSQFSRKARSADFVIHAWEALRTADGKSGDRVLGTALDVFVFLVSRDPRDLHELVNRTNLTPVLLERFSKMTRKTDPLFILNGAENDMELKQKGFNRTEKPPVSISLTPPFHHREGLNNSSQLSNLEEVVTRSSIFPEGTPVTVFLDSLPRLELKPYPRYPTGCF